ncbi:MAG: hypothetical protein CVU96_03545 [Firmicutes bacterium HGW-Firmicutes-20]|jgi:hypothetical protein|nr:MAG: hypothetical protein CVU96_03545 [Firmicutes bacterium HGW-Firmicutes-20]PKM66228.1 MAG: hypothetical protein CVU94_07685 [Firmicutes bacterium HGW-Firmicutes-19]
MDTFYVRCSMVEAEKLLDQYIIDGSITGTCIGRHTTGSVGQMTVIIIYEKHYYRAGNRLTLTVVLDDITGSTRVFACGGGGGQGLFRFDWGAAQNFKNSAFEALKNYIK